MADEAAQQQKIGNFVIFDKIGKGGMGAVYKAEDLTLERTVVCPLAPIQRTLTHICGSPP